MEKTNNGYYRACGIINYIFGIFCVFFTTMILSYTIADPSILEQSYLEAVFSDPSFAEVSLYSFKAAFYVLFAILFLSSAMLIVVGSFFLRYASMTDKEAYLKNKNCLAWVIVSYFFGGTLIGILATVGYVTIQNKQKEKYLASLDQEKQQTANSSKEKYSLENLEIMQKRLTILAELKESKAISKEEFDALRKEVMIKEEEKKDDNPDELNSEKLAKLGERLKKLEDLKQAKAITEEEYASLREKIMNSKD